MSEALPFIPAKLAAMREEILRAGVSVDKFLGYTPDVPTFGLNLACAWPFPAAWRAGYEELARKLSALGPEIYVYPFSCTHITLVTLMSFRRHVEPPADLIESLQRKIPAILSDISPLFTGSSPERIRPFVLQPQSPVLARGAGFLPLLNPDGEVARLRRRAVELLQANPTLHGELTECGFNVPGIIHSTVLRFTNAPSNLERFLEAFDEIARIKIFPPATVNEVLLTSETKPYMRAGEIVQRLKLTAAA